MRVLIVENSPSVNEILKAILESEPGIEVAGIVSSGQDALQFVLNNKVDVITMDVNLEDIDGLEATKRIMAVKPKPIIIMSSSFDPKNSKDVFKAIGAGALGVFDKPHSFGTPEFDKYAKDLIRKVKIFSGVSVVKRRRTRIKSNALRNHSPQKTELNEKNIKLIAIGASTGGPQTLKEIFQFIRKDFPIPIVAVQHITKNFCEPMVNWLNELSPLDVKLAEHNESLEPGKVYFAPDDYHLEITKFLTSALVDSPPVHSSKPSISMLFRSISSNITPAVGILLTGMGRDGAAELKEMKDSGSLTIAQSEDSCIVYGMPMEAVKLGGASYSLSPTEIIEYLNKLGDKIYEA